MKTKNTMKMVTALLVLALTFGSMLPFCFAEGEVGTTKENPYVVTTAAQLTELGSLDEIGYVKLGADIDMSGKAATECVIKKLTGELDGGGYTVSNLTLKGGKGVSGSPLKTGFIGELSGDVKNLKLYNITVSEIDNLNNAGVLAGSIPNGSNVTIDHCRTTGSITADNKNSNQYTGGLIGFLYSTANEPSTVAIHNCATKVTIQNDTSYNSMSGGGLIGATSVGCTLTVEKCAVLGDFTANYSGGLVGWFQSYSATVTVSDSYFGGKIMKARYGYGIGYNTMALQSLQCTNFYFDKTKNTYLDAINKGGYSISSGVKAQTTDELKALSIEGFAASDVFDGYPVPAEDPPAQNSIAFDGDSAAVTVRESGRYTVVFAAYQGSKLQSCAMLADDFTAGTAKTVSAPESFNASGATTVKAMLWRSAANLCPLAGNAQK